MSNRPKNSSGQEVLSMPIGPTPPDSKPVPLAALFNAIWDNLAHLHNNGTQEPPAYLKEGGIWARPYDGGKQILIRVPGSGQQALNDSEVLWTKEGAVSFPIGSARNLPLEITDLNDLKSVGLFAAPAGTANMPDSAAFGTVWVQKHTFNELESYYQILTTTDAFYVRGTVVETGVVRWSDWNRFSSVMLSDAVDSNSSTTAASSRAVKTVYEMLGTSSRVTLRNLILNAKNDDGAPTFLTSQDWLRTPHGKGKALGPIGKVSASSRYSDAFHESHAFANQVVYTGSVWGTVANSITGWIEYEYKESFVPTGMNIVCLDELYWPSSFVVEGYDESMQTWRVLFQNTNYRPAFGRNETFIAPQFGTTFWFTQNRQAFKRIRFRNTQSTGSHVSITTIRFFTCEHVDLSPFDVILDASPETPFTASIASGPDSDKIVSITRPVLIPGKLLYEQSRNYLYVVAALPDGSPPDYIDAAHSVHVEESGVYIWASTKAIDFSVDLDNLRSKCAMEWQANESANRTITTPSQVIDAAIGYRPHELLAQYVSYDTTKAHRGSTGSWLFGSNDTSIVFTQESYLQAFAPAATSQSGSMPFTLELDFEYKGPQNPVSGTSMVLFDNSSTVDGLSGFRVGYSHLYGYLWATSFKTAAAWVAPFVAQTGVFYTLSVSHVSDKIFFHVNGKCIAFYDAATVFFSSSQQGFGIGRSRMEGKYTFNGHINNVRYVFGQCLRQNEDYIVSGKFSTNGILDSTLWWNHVHGSVQKYSESTQTWADVPMLGIGHIDTGTKEHLHTWQPRGTDKKYNIDAVVAYTANGVYSVDTFASQISNFALGGAFPYRTPPGTANNTAAYWVQLQLSRPMCIEELRLIGAATSQFTFPSVFLWQGSNDASTWETLVDRSTFVQDGSASLAALHFLGDVHNVNGQKLLPQRNNKEFLYYRITFLPKGAIPQYAGSDTACRCHFIMKDASPEIQTVQPYAIGAIFAARPFMAAAGYDYVIPIPFGGAPFDTSMSYIMEKNDFQSKKRQLGQTWSAYNVANTPAHAVSGEYVYTTEDTVFLTMGNHGTSVFSGDAWSGRTTKAQSSHGDVYVIARRIY